MAKKKKKDILVINPSSKEQYFLSDSILSLAELKGKRAPDFICSFIPANSVKYAAISASSDGDESSEEQVANKTYETLDLDIEIDYQIRYALSEALSNGSEDIYSVFAVETQQITTSFKEIVKTCEYIDYLDTEPLLYGAYYSSSYLEASGVDVFLYMHKNYASFCIYKDGQLNAFRCLNKLSLDAIHAAYCQELAERIPENVFLEEFDKFGLDHPDSSKRVALHNVFATACMLLANNINFTLRQLRAENTGISSFVLGGLAGAEEKLLDKFKAIFAHFKNADVDVFTEAMLENNKEQTDNSITVHEYLAMHKMRCDMFKNSKNFLDENERSTIDPLAILMLYRANEQLREKNDIFNMSVFLRPPPFAKRQSGQLIIAAAAAVVLSGVYPGFNYASGYITALEKEELLEQIPPKQKIKDALKQKIDALSAENEQLQSEISSKEQRLNLRTGLLNKLYDKKVDYALKAERIANLTKLINASGAQILRLESDGMRFKLELIGTNLQITKFIKSIGQNPSYELDTPNLNISRKEESQRLYTSSIEIRTVE